MVRAVYDKPAYYSVWTVELTKWQVDWRSAVSLQVVEPAKMAQQFFVEHF